MFSSEMVFAGIHSEKAFFCLQVIGALSDRPVYKQEQLGRAGAAGPVQRLQERGEAAQVHGEGQPGGPPLHPPVHHAQPQQGAASFFKPFNLIYFSF